MKVLQRRNSAAFATSAFWLEASPTAPYGRRMSDLKALEAEIAAAIVAARDERALEDLRVATLGKKGSISERLKGLGRMGPEERKSAGAELNSLRDSVSRRASSSRRAVLAESALEARLRPKPWT